MHTRFCRSYRSHFGLTPTQRYSPMKPRCRWRTPSAEQDPTSRPQSNGHSRQRLCNRCLVAATHLTTTTTPTLTRASAPPIDASEVNAPCGAYRSADEVMTKCSAPVGKFQRRMRNERPGVVRGPRRTPATRRVQICANCGAEFMSGRSSAKWCSRSCQGYARVTGQRSRLACDLVDKSTAD